MHKRSGTAKNRDRGWARPPVGSPSPRVEFIVGERSSKARLERELGHPICGFRMGGVICTLEPGHSNPLHSGDYRQGGAE